jgi:Xaa-Pro aminopeptidase
MIGFYGGFSKMFSMGMIKTKSEIRLLKKSAQITDSCLKIIEDSLKEEITEKELMRRIGRKIRSHNASLAFQTLVASGGRSAMIHPKPFATNRVINGIGFVDFGACFRGYRTDVTVPFVKGKISKKERKIINIVLKAYDVAISSIRLNQPCWKLFQKMYDYIKRNGFELKHGLGHGLGLKIHEYPFIVVPSKEKIKRRDKRIWKKIKNINFQKNMVFTIEPGIYVKGFGGCRLENDFLLTSKGPLALTHSKLILA